MLNSFRCSETEKIARSNVSRKFPQGMQRVALRKLRQLEAANTLDDMRIPPGNRLEPLKGSREGQHSVRINNQWRLCFRFENGDAYDVEIVDYHR